MRLIGTIKEEKQARRFLYFLSTKGVAGECECHAEQCPGGFCRIWIYDEDQVDLAREWLERFVQQPEATTFSGSTELPPKEMPTARSGIPRRPLRPQEFLRKNHDLGKWNLTLLFTCITLFLIQLFTSPQLPTLLPSSLPAAPFFFAPIQKKLLFDWPKAYELTDKLLKLYPIEQLQEPDKGPAEMQLLVRRVQQTPYWQGIYVEILQGLQSSPTPTPQGPLFEKIREGEIWRLFTPALLHADLLHIFFNILWLILLGPQLEERLGSWRYVLFLLITALLSNTAQYLMGGANFLGLSGIICAMLGFIWMRQRRAAWEGYLLHRSMLLFVGCFIALMFLIQAASFFYELITHQAFTTGIANTAHLVGGAIGILCGRLNFFAWHPKQ